MRDKLWPFDEDETGRLFIVALGFLIYALARSIR
jgi:hypothetical protein